MTIDLPKTINKKFYINDEGLKIIKSGSVSGSVYLSPTKSLTHCNIVNVEVEMEQAKVTITESDLEEFMEKASSPFFGMTRESLRRSIFGDKK